MQSPNPPKSDKRTANIINQSAEILIRVLINIMNQNQMQSFQNKQPPLHSTFLNPQSTTKQSYRQSDVNLEISDNSSFQNDAQKINKQVNKVLAFEKFSKPQLLLNDHQDVQISMCENNIKNINIGKQCKSVKFNLGSLGQQKAQSSVSYQKEKFIKHLDFDDEDDELSEYSQEILVKVRNNENIKSILKPTKKKIEKSIHKIITIDQVQGRKYDQEEQKVFQQKVAKYRYGKGLMLLQKFGFELGSGLGKEQDGIIEPLEIKMQDQIGQINPRKRVKVDCIDLSEEELVNQQSSDSKTLPIENNEEQGKKQQFLKYLLYLNQEEVIITQNGLDIVDLHKFQECFIKFKQYFIEYNLLGLLINKCEQKIKLQMKNWSGPRTQNDLLLKEFSLISKTINFAKQVIQNDTKTISQQELFILKKYMNTLVNPILKQLKAYILEKQYNLILNDFIEFWSKSTICVVQVANQNYPIYLNLENAMEEIKKASNQQQPISRPFRQNTS